MIRTQISLDPVMYDAARLEARKRGISFAELVRRALSEAIPSAVDQPWMVLAGVIETEVADLT